MTEEEHLRTELEKAAAIIGEQRGELKYLSGHHSASTKIIDDLQGTVHDLTRQAVSTYLCLHRALHRVSSPGLPYKPPGETGAPYLAALAQQVADALEETATRLANREDELRCVPHVVPPGRGAPGAPRSAPGAGKPPRPAAPTSRRRKPEPP